MGHIRLEKKVNKKIGIFLRKIRTEQGLTGTDVANILHISQQQISRYERGISNISLGMLFYLLTALNVNIHSLFHYLIDEFDE
ncbi:MAG: helix-turn-helix domain-containing protein [Providencia sp.]|nr:helix-turn-helix domain-containing protein [Providencia sp.]